MSFHLCSSQKYTSLRRRVGVLFHNMMAEEMRKCGNVTSDACDKADGAKYSFPRGGQKGKSNAKLGNVTLDAWDKAGDAKYSLPRGARDDGRSNAKRWKCHLRCMR